MAPATSGSADGETAPACRASVARPRLGEVVAGERPAAVPQSSKSGPARTLARRFFLSALPLALLLVGGCGGSDEPTDTDAIKRVLADSINAAHSGDQAKACSVYTPAYVREIFRETRGLQPTGDSCREVVSAFEDVLKRLTADPKPKVTDVEVSGDKATARMEIETYFGPATTKVFAARKDGAWKINHDQDPPEGPQSPGVGVRDELAESRPRA